MGRGNYGKESRLGKLGGIAPVQVDFLSLTYRGRPWQWFFRDTENHAEQPRRPRWNRHRSGESEFLSDSCSSNLMLTNTKTD
ncbi:hypothetical protein Y032_0309g2076 [Ancylostoma ceylanicum]|uniref:Uncharacterized protein n=1 Tax=Ancylostoma ceylanicum TaxID=53326 RepID=A0A016S3B4_9BILA|nr:hypothetical protein Y032_0309g2076 [Ancylostoma ceylanicum]